MKSDFGSELRAALDVLSRSEIERAWAAADAATKALDSSSYVLRAEVAARILASILTEVSAKTTSAGDLAAALPAIEGLGMYAIMRTAAIATGSD